MGDSTSKRWHHYQSPVAHSKAANSSFSKKDGWAFQFSFPVRQSAILTIFCSITLDSQRSTSPQTCWYTPRIVPKFRSHCNAFNRCDLIDVHYSLVSRLRAFQYLTICNGMVISRRLHCVLLIGVGLWIFLWLLNAADQVVRNTLWSSAGPAHVTYLWYFLTCS